VRSNLAGRGLLVTRELAALRNAALCGDWVIITSSSHLIIWIGDEHIANSRPNKSDRAKFALKKGDPPKPPSSVSCRNWLSGEMA
jgi:hypothetical protein